MSGQKSGKSQKLDRREYVRVHKFEKREYPRVIVKLETEISSIKRYQVSGWTRDISVKGVYVMCDGKLPVGVRCSCKLALGDVLKGAPQIELSGKVVRCDTGGIAVQFTRMATECLKKVATFFLD